MMAGFMSGFNDGVNAMSNLETSQLRTQAAKHQQQLAEAKLTEWAQNAPQRKTEQELKLQQLQAQTNSINSADAKNTTYSAFRMFNADKDTRHLNQFLADVKKNPVGQRMWGTVQSFAPLTKTPENDQLLKQAGYADYNNIYDSDLAKDMIIVTNTNGDKKVGSVYDLYAGTGFNNYMEQESLAIMEQKARIQSQLKAGKSVKQVSLREQVVQDLVNSGKAENVSEAYGMVFDMEKGSKPATMSTAEERQIQQIMSEADAAGNPISYLEATSQFYSAKNTGKGSDRSNYVSAYMAENPGATPLEANNAYDSRTPTSTQKDIAATDDVYAALDDMNWLDADLSTMSTSDRVKAEREVAKLEQLVGYKPSSEDRKVLRNLNVLTDLGNTTGSQLTPEQTGLIDSTLNFFKKYTMNEVGGKEGTAAYNSFRNIFRNALFGTALSEHESKEFVKAAGDLKQQFVPVMEQFKVQLGTIKSQLEAIRDTGNPYIMKKYTGMGLEKIDSVIDSIDARLDDPSLWNAGTKAAQSGRNAPAPKKVAPVPPTQDTVDGSDFDFDAAWDAEFSK